MKYSSHILLLFLVFHTAFPARSKQVAFSCAGSVIVLMDSSSAARSNAQPDNYTRELTPFDLAIRLDKAPEEVTQNDYLQKAAHAVRDWPADDQAQLRQAFARIDSFVTASGIYLHMPDTVKMIKTTGQEEFGAEGYTRNNRIMLNTGAQPISLHLVVHELWHVISRLNEGLRNSAYAVFHFKPCNNIRYKPALHGQVITNPDCPYLQHYVRITKDETDQDVVPVFYSKRSYQPGYGMMEYANLGLLALTGDDAHKEPLMKDGEPVIYDMGATPGFLEKVGTNTPYVLHIEEITAEHFAALLTGKRMPEMEYVNGLKKALMRN